VAWTLFGGLALIVIVFGVQAATERFVRLFRQPVYQGLGAGLVAAGLVMFLAALSFPLVRACARLISMLAPRLPTWINPTRRGGAFVWLLLISFGGSLLAPMLIKAFHTLDLRPARLVLVWPFLLVGLLWWFDRRTRRWPALAVAIGLATLFGVCFGWAAGNLGESQRSLVAVDRDTLLAGPLTRRLSTIGDRDGDGVSRLFAGGDCDDTDPTIRPGVYDPPGDGIDQNCTGIDLAKNARAFVRQVRRTPLKAHAKHVVLITVDALRDDIVADHMPKLAAMAAENVHFTNAYSHGAATYWSLPALLASKMPSAMHMGRDQTPVNRELLFTEVLRNGGWHTSLFANVTVFFVRGLRQGALTTNYDTSHYTVHGAKPGSAHLTDALLEHADKWQKGALKPAREKLHIWAHYYDPHDPYFEVPGYPASDDSDRARYVAIARYVDDEIARLVSGLKARGLWKDTLFVLTADHGDEFLDHGHRFHGATLYEEMVHVPLVMHVPGIKKRIIDGPVGHMELAPTMLELLGKKVPQQYEGRSRSQEILTGAPAPLEPVYFEVFPDSNYSGHQVGLRLGSLKLIYRLTENIFELYDLERDPRERDNVYDTHPEAPGLRLLLAAYVDHHLYALGQGKSGAKQPPGSPKKSKSKRKRSSKSPKKPKAKKPSAKKPPAKKPSGPLKSGVIGGQGKIQLPALPAQTGVKKKGTQGAVDGARPPAKHPKKVGNSL